MNALLLAFLVFVGVTGLVGAVSFLVLRGAGAGRAQGRLDLLVGRRGRARALRAGHSLAAGLHVVADEMPEPISKEFGRVYEEQNLGVSLEDALNHMCDRVPNLDLRFFVTSVNIQRQTGGDLAEILDRIG